MDTSEHPCFDPSARHKYARIHLPVAPRCNVQCNFCDRKQDCLNEGRPGVTSTLLTPRQALAYTKRIVSLKPETRVVGIAGPGDPFANPTETLKTFQLVREAFPDILLCVATNGLELEAHVPELARLATSHVTVTINALDPEVLGQIYRWVRTGGRVYRGTEAGEVLAQRQWAGVDALVAAGVTVKINTIFIPTVNEEEQARVAEKAAEHGAHLQNTMGLLTVPGTPFGELPAPQDDELAEARALNGTWLPQMMHCSRCRADAAGLIGEGLGADAAELLRSARDGQAAPSESRPYVAVASHEGVLVNQHLGESQSLWIFGQTPKGFELVERRAAPPTGGGDKRWRALGLRLEDCCALLTSGAGNAPRQALDDCDVPVLIADSLIQDALSAIYAGRPLRAPFRETRCGDGCTGTGAGCG